MRTGLFVVALDAAWAASHYHFESVTLENEAESFGDPYCFAPLLTEFDIHLFVKGQHRKIYDKLGAHPRQVNGVAGVNFAVWAPNCYKVAVVGDFNRWDPRTHAMENNNDSGIWELFVPGLKPGDRYKYEVRSHNQGYRAAKSDSLRILRRGPPRYGFYHL